MQIHLKMDLGNYSFRKAAILYTCIANLLTYSRTLHEMNNYTHKNY